MADLSIPKHNTPGEAAVLPILIDGKWVEKRERDAVRSPFDGGIVSYEPKSTRSDFNAALDAAARAKSVWQFDLVNRSVCPCWRER
jgi:hypothetical protein